ncbi:Mitochondrial 10-formyltetrahydrofolate dehydrogenase [Liparis tanakae]|uniref:Mitochondrial 10-formyltetrahydrofolate dehydrogenase n=1 Tax=Liparis tanakae TaxID=230148 RepID=A0A4Z2FHS1_9TELE|nr:Mitochondrial 10-formyltetrahydrofolate dehydrogenase [Liparis tanakae]
MLYVDLAQPAKAIHDWIRGHDKVPGAWTVVDGQSVTLYGSSMLGGAAPAGQPLEIEGASQPGLVTKNGLVLYGSDGKALLVKSLQFEDGKMIPASKYFSSGESSSVELTDDEKKMAEEIRASWRRFFS